MLLPGAGCLHPLWEMERLDGNQVIWTHFPEIAHLTEGRCGQAPELLVHHVIVVIAQPQFHCYKSGPLLHPERGGDKGYVSTCLEKRLP